MSAFLPDSVKFRLPLSGLATMERMEKSSEYHKVQNGRAGNTRWVQRTRVSILFLSDTSCRTRHR